ncbi:hypothetical protein BC830DRAFT_1143798 [Chytriomyces sp. MP71]|nr:hypothetical protein BC830DRAFT_1144897 [Chytriomyces sp. MP71]KAI8610866.1 hypothetical protein BC830DRAFT_1143798 [Chytriomyces sp. MP71]
MIAVDPAQTGICTEPAKPRVASRLDSSITLNGEIEKDLLTTQPVELVTRMLGFLGAEDLATVSSTCKLMHCLATQDLLWKKLCADRWQIKKHVPLALHPYVDYSSLVHKLDRVEKESILARRFIAHSLYAADTDEELSERVVHTMPVAVPEVRVFEPVACGKWQASYIAAEMDQHRSRITMDELNAYEFTYHDNWGHGFYMNNEREDAIRVRFFPNGFRGNAISDDKPRRPRPMPYHFTPTGAIQVGQYPTHSRPRRLENWGWEFSNSYVQYTSI